MFVVVRQLNMEPIQYILINIIKARKNVQCRKQQTNEGYIIICMNVGHHSIGNLTIIDYVQVEQVLQG